MKDSLFQDLLESIKSLPTNVLKEMKTNMEQEQMREEFEQWAANHYWLQEFGPERNLDNLNEYLDAEVQLAWEAWKASREHLVVNLPSKSLYDNYKVSCYKCDVEESLTNQGIKWK